MATHQGEDRLHRISLGSLLKKQIKEQQKIQKGKNQNTKLY